MTILVITTNVTNKKTGKTELVVSHGIDLSTGRNVVLPTDPPKELGAVWSNEYQEYVLEG